MPNFDTIAEWVLDNLYLAGGGTGALLLALLLVLLLILRAKRSPKRPAVQDVFGQPLQPTEEMDLHTPLSGSFDSPPADLSNGDDYVYTPLEDDRHTAPALAAPLPPPAAAIPFRPTPGAGDEHVLSVVKGLLDGRGELTGAELRRIELLRPEKVLAVIDQVEGTLTGRGKDTQRARLLKLRQYAGLLAPGAETETLTQDLEAPTGYDEYVGVAPEPVVLPGQWGETTHGPGDAATEAPDLILDHELSLLPEEPAEAPPPPEQPSQQKADAAPAVIEEPAPAATVTPGWSREDSADWLPGAIPAASIVQPAAIESSDPDSDLQQPDQEPPPTSDGLEPVIGEAMWTTPPAGTGESELYGGIETFHDERDEMEEESWDAESWTPSLSDADEDEEEPEEVFRHAVANDTLNAGPALSALDVRLETAEDVLGLDEAERENALAFLKAGELGRLFASTQDPRLKFSIIDALAHAPNADSIEALQTCLDDPDPKVQLYALDAAERMLRSA
ncbi:MAG: hypothetical protein ACYCX3_04620 [Thermoleophilia bacterium]